MKKTVLIGVIAVLAIVGGLFFFGQNGGQRTTIVKEGDRAPDFRLLSLEGKTVSLSSFRGRVVMVHFWATWCPPCVEEIPTLERLNRTFADRDFDILAVSVDEGGANAVASFMKKNRLSLPVLLSPDRSAASLYGTFKFPETYLVDREGIVRKKLIGAVDWTHPEAQQFVRAMLDRR
jgi:peroxiredoxin